MVKGTPFQYPKITRGDVDLIITHRLKMNLEEPEALQRLEMPMGDAGSREIEMHLYANQSIWPIPEGVTTVIRYRKPDGTMGEYDTLPDGNAAWSVFENILKLKLAPQVLAAAGSVILYATLYLEGKILQTFATEIYVKTPFEYGTVSRAAASRDYAYVTNVLRGPVTAEKGQVLMVASVDESGRVTGVEALDAVALVEGNGSAVRYKAQNLTDSQKNQARTNIGAASQMAVDFLAGKFTSNGIYLSDEKTGEGYVLYVKNGKLTMEKE